jgi:hypothetical protein
MRSWSNTASIIFSALLVFLGVFAFVGSPVLAQQAGDGIPPKISNITITSASATATVVTWETDENADSLVNYGIDKSYGIVRDALANKKKHKLILTDIEPSTLYHLRVVSSDEYGNQALSGDYVFTSKDKKDIPSVKNLSKEEQVNVQRAVNSIEQLKTEEGIRTVVQALGETARRVLEPPVISGVPSVSEVESDSAVISWITDHESNSIVECVSDYDPSKGEANYEGPTVIRQGNFDELVKEHTVHVVGFRPGTLYHCRVISEDEIGLRGISRELILTTKAVLADILSFRVLKVEEDAATLNWRTSVPAAGAVEYTDTKTKVTKTAGSPDFASSHTVRIAGLRLGARYQAVARAENALGEKTTSKPLSFTTVKDTAPPLISKVSNDSTLYPSAEAKVQTIVSWATDETSFCQFYFREGLNPGIEPTGLGEEKEPRTAHVQVVVEFLPSTVYQFWVECRDRMNNKTQSENFVLFTPNKEKSIIDIILENFQGTFGWVKNIGK